MFLAFVMLMVWMFRVYRTGESRGASDNRWSRWWAVGAWLIPLANLVLPWLVGREAERLTSHGAGQPPTGQRWQGVKVSKSSSWFLVASLGYLVFNVAARIFASLAGPASPLSGVAQALWAAQNLTLAIGWSLGIVWVRRVGEDARVTPEGQNPASSEPVDD